MATIEDLRLLLQFPSENLSIEYKSWLDITDNAGKATLAKAAIALANEGGGIIVLGMREDFARGGALGSQPRPPGMARYNQDNINAAIERFADPAFHCSLMFAEHPTTGVEHAFVIVPGGMTVPVMSARGSDGIIQTQRCYIRKPGPRSEEPFTSEEWRGVMERCLQARRETMLDAIRVIIQGHGTSPPPSEAQDRLVDFARAAQARWLDLIEDLPQDDVARMPFGHYQLGFDMLDVPAAPTLNDLLRRMQDASRIKHTGWGPFVLLTREPFQPHPVAGNLEAWTGEPVADRLARTAAHCDFWRASPSGRLFLQRGYDEDSTDRTESGTLIDVTIPIWRVGEALLYVSRLARLFAADPQIRVRCKYTGLRGRRLGALDPARNFFMREYNSVDDDAELQAAASAREIDDNLVEVVHPLLVPLYERFSLFDLTVDLVRQELDRLRRGRF
jgi:Putative DNA-binding domain